jgi:hypothetical protein
MTGLTFFKGREVRLQVFPVQGAESTKPNHRRRKG